MKPNVARSNESTVFQVTLKTHIIKDLKDMEKNTKVSVDALVEKALLMFIATHSDFLGKR